MKTTYANAIAYLSMHTVATMGARRWYVPIETLELTATLWDKDVLTVIKDIVEYRTIHSTDMEG